MEITASKAFERHMYAARVIFENMYEDPDGENIEKFIGLLADSYISECNEFRYTDISRYSTKEQVATIAEWAKWSTQLANILNDLLEAHKRGYDTLIWDVEF